jgi:hypothetical protein
VHHPEDESQLSSGTPRGPPAIQRTQGGRQGREGNEGKKKEAKGRLGKDQKDGGE